MRITIGYDGSDFARAAIEDLLRAGLGDEVEARIVTVADQYPHLSDTCYAPVDQAAIAQMQPKVRQAHELGARAMAEARQTASEGAQHIAGMFPKWKVEPVACTGKATAALIDQATASSADLIVIGSQGRGALARALLGSVSQGIISNANCSVRIGRRRPDAPTTQDPSTPPRIVLGLDGSPHAAAALNAVSLRHWPPNTEVRIVLAVDIRLTAMLPAMSHEFSWPVVIDPELQDWPVHAAEAAAKELRRSGMKVTPVVQEGEPKRVLVEEADAWPADCIFVGARGVSRLQGMLLGSVSSSVAARAHCSVEVVRFE